MTISCPICLDLLSIKPFGCIAPCGHYFHQECYNSWVSISLNNSSRYNTTKCPSCNTAAGTFIRSFLDLEKLGQGLDDISISDSDADSNDDCDDGDENCDSSQESDSCGGPVDEDEFFDTIVKKHKSWHLRKKDTNSKKVGEEDEVIVLSGDDDESDEENSFLSGKNSRTARSTSSRNGVHEEEAISSRSVQFKRSGSFQSNQKNRYDGQGTNCVSDNGSLETVSQGKSKRNAGKLEKKYKRLKKQLLAIKETVARQQEQSAEYDELQSKYQQLKQSNKDLKAKLKLEMFDNARYKGEIKTLKKNMETLKSETRSLEEKLESNSIKFDRETERLRNFAQSIKVENMEEMKLILEQNKQLKKENHNIMQDLKTLSAEKNETDKLNIRLKKRLKEFSREEYAEQTMDQKNEKPPKRSKLIELFREGLKEAENHKRRDEEEERMLKQQIEKQNMIRKSSTQTSRVLAAVNTQKRLKRYTSSFANTATGIGTVSPPSDTRNLASTKTLKSGSMVIVRKRPASHDLRRMFKRK